MKSGGNEKRKRERWWCEKVSISFYFDVQKSFVCLWQRVRFEPGSNESVLDPFLKYDSNLNSDIRVLKIGPKSSKMDLDLWTWAEFRDRCHFNLCILASQLIINL